MSLYPFSPSWQPHTPYGHHAHTRMLCTMLSEGLRCAHHNEPDAVPMLHALIEKTVCPLKRDALMASLVEFALKDGSAPLSPVYAATLSCVQHMERCGWRFDDQDPTVRARTVNALSTHAGGYASSLETDSLHVFLSSLTRMGFPWTTANQSANFIFDLLNNGFSTRTTRLLHAFHHSQIYPASPTLSQDALAHHVVEMVKKQCAEKINEGTPYAVQFATALTPYLLQIGGAPLLNIVEKALYAFSDPTWGTERHQIKACILDHLKRAEHELPKDQASSVTPIKGTSPRRPRT